MKKIKLQIFLKMEEEILKKLKEIHDIIEKTLEKWMSEKK